MEHAVDATLPLPGGGVGEVLTFLAHEGPKTMLCSTYDSCSVWNVKMTQALGFMLSSAYFSKIKWRLYIYIYIYIYVYTYIHTENTSTEKPKNTRWSADFFLAVRARQHSENTVEVHEFIASKSQAHRNFIISNLKTVRTRSYPKATSCTTDLRGFWEIWHLKLDQKVEEY